MARAFASLGISEVEWGRMLQFCERIAGDHKTIGINDMCVANE